ncbi:MAG TPA: hypothetical protein VKE50_10320 [Thermoanaerobaculia bacterium]|nr:hypothetical protein [Thermoanaerobaculia bacterium]
MQIKDRDNDWASVDDPLESRFRTSFRGGLGFQSSDDEEETMTATLELPDEPEALDQKDRIGEDTRPRR